MVGRLRAFRIGRLVAALMVLAVVLVSPGQASAQQETGNVVPEIRNPQSNPVNLHQQESDLQNTSPQQLLNETNSDIRIPAGRPTPLPARQPAPEQSLWSSYWYIIILGLLPAIFYALSMKPDKSVPQPEVPVDSRPLSEVTTKTKPKKRTGKKKQPRSKRKG